MLGGERGGGVSGLSTERLALLHKEWLQMKRVIRRHCG